MSRLLVPLVVVALLAGCHKFGPQPKREFVCNIHDQLSERHVEVRSAAFVSNSGNWVITYTNGSEVVYNPRRGESCGVEEY